jgi:transposase-like protein
VFSASVNISSPIRSSIRVSTKPGQAQIYLFQDHQEDAFPGSGNLRPEEAEKKQLLRRIADLEEENAILKKATAIFAKHQR